jgi:bacteriocin-like protein
MRELNVNELQEVNGGDFKIDGCSLPSFGEAASIYGVGGGIGMTLGAATGYSALAAIGGYIGVALAGSFMAGFSIGVGLNHLVGACDSE